MVHAGFWRRFFAYTIDAVLQLLFFFLLLFCFLKIVGEASSGFLSNLLMFKEKSPFWAFLSVDLPLFLLPPALFAAFEGSKYEATPGKMICGLRVLDLEYQRSSYLRVFVRQLLKAVFSFLLFKYLAHTLHEFTQAGWASLEGWGYLAVTLICLASFLVMIYSSKKQALYDMMSGCCIVRRFSTKLSAPSA